MIIAVVAVGLHTLPTTAIIVMSIAHRYLQQKKRRTLVLLFVPLEVLFSNELLTDLGRIWALRYIIADPKVVEYNYYIKRS